ncbi:hypothetical protein ES706_02382 [subsurface metagenome]
MAITRVQRQRRVSFTPGLMRELNLEEGDKVIFRRVDVEIRGHSQKVPRRRVKAMVVSKLEAELKG